MKNLGHACSATARATHERMLTRERSAQVLDALHMREPPARPPDDPRHQLTRPRRMTARLPTGVTVVDVSCDKSGRTTPAEHDSCRPWQRPPGGYDRTLARTA